jgi:hypothetical protein
MQGPSAIDEASRRAPSALGLTGVSNAYPDCEGRKRESVKEEGVLGSSAGYDKARQLADSLSRYAPV